MFFKNKMPLFILIFFLFFGKTSNAANQNPFFTKKKQPQKQNCLNFPSESLNLFINNNYYFRQFVEFQKNIREYLTETMENIKQKKSISTLAILLFVSFFYGILHSAGPGHGKIILCSYITGETIKIKTLFFSALLISIIHSSSSVIIIFLLKKIYETSILKLFENSHLNMRYFSALLIFGIGMVLLIKSFFSLKKKTSNIVKNKELKNNKSLFAAIIAIGIVPCPGAMLVLLYSVNLNFYILGIVCVIFMSAGMAFTIFTTASAFQYLKNRFLKLFYFSNFADKYLVKSLSVLSAVLVLCSSLILVI